MSRFVLIAILVASSRDATRGAPSTDGAGCASCHRPQALPQPATSMGRALETAAKCQILRENPRLNVRVGPYSYKIVRDGESTLYTVTDGKETITAPVAWAFGLGAAGQTYVYQWKGNWYESRVSFFKAIRGLDLTMGAQSTAPNDLEEAAGRRMSVKDTTECFACHATNAIQKGKLRIEGLLPGVRCERCHGPTEQHAAAVKSGDVKGAAMPKLGNLTAEEMSDFCGQCHRTWSQIAAEGPHDINNVRFQPYRLTNSKCYDSADARIRCVACHDPHREVEHATAFYDAKCLACHAGRKSVNLATERHAKPCPRAAKDCVTCHMPKYEMPGSHNLFSDHQIRVVKPGEPYPG
jgi:hypothetical protein